MEEEWVGMKRRRTRCRWRVQGIWYRVQGAVCRVQGAPAVGGATLRHEAGDDPLYACAGVPARKQARV